MKLRSYQEAAIAAIFEKWTNHRSTVVVLPTGCGKTVVFASVIKELLDKSSGRVMVLAHREELIMQAKAKIEAIANVAVEVEMGEFKTGDFFGSKAPVIVSTVQTQLNRKDKFDPSEFAAVIVDEAHHAVAKSYRDVLSHYLANENCKLLGVTATPDRADETALGGVFESVAYEYTIAEAIKEGWLVPLRQELVKVESLDFSGVTTSAGDLNAAELAEVMEDEKNLHGVASATLQIAKEKRAIVFAASLKQAERLAEIFNRSSSDGKPSVADFVSGMTPKEERRGKLEAFKRGETRYMVNVGVLTEGFDDAGVEVVVMARPTKSRALYAQMAGRATRPAEDVASELGKEELPELRTAMIRSSAKPSALIIDFVGNSGRHKLITSFDILGGKDEDPEVLALAREKSLERKEGTEQDVFEEIESAREEIKARKEREAKRRAFIQATAKFVSIAVDPMNPFDLPPPEKNPRNVGRRFSLKQEAVLRRLKINPDTLDYAQGEAIIKENFRRMNEGLASLIQTKYLRQYNVPVAMPLDEARRTLTRLFKR